MSAARVRGAMDASVNVVVDALVDMSQTPGDESAIIEEGRRLTGRTERAIDGAQGVFGEARDDIGGARTCRARTPKHARLQDVRRLRHHGARGRDDDSRDSGWRQKRGAQQTIGAVSILPSRRGGG